MTSLSRTTQSGSALLEAMIAMLIFAFGVLAIVGLQAAMVGASADAKYRTEAGFFASRLLGEMWVADRNSAAGLAPYATSGAAYYAWHGDMKNAASTAGLLGLPGADTNPPTVVITPVTNPLTGFPVSYDVVVNVFWQAPGKPVHKHVVVASITAD